MKTTILSLSLFISILALPAASSPSTSFFAIKLLTEVHALRLSNQIAISVAQEQKIGRHLPTKASLALLDHYLNQPQDEELYDRVRTILGANREKFDNLIAIRQLEYQCKRLAAQLNRDNDDNEGVNSQARQLFVQHQHLFDATASQRLTTPAVGYEYLEAEERLMASLMEEELEESEESNSHTEQLVVSFLVNSDDRTISDLFERTTNEILASIGDTPTQRNATIISSRDDIDTVSAIKSSKDFHRVSDKIARRLIKAVYKNNTDDITHILDENSLSANIVIDNIGTTLLQHAAGEGKLPVVQHLIDNLAADINVENKLHFTTLDAAVFAKQYNIAELLIERGAVSADPDLQGNRKGVPTLK